MKKVLFAPAVLAFAACGKNDESHTRSWYRDHDAERNKMVAQCTDDAAKELTPECMNAINADFDVFINGKGYDRSGGRDASNQAPNLTGK